ELVVVALGLYAKEQDFVQNLELFLEQVVLPRSKRTLVLSRLSNVHEEAGMLETAAKMKATVNKFDGRVTFEDVDKIFLGTDDRVTMHTRLSTKMQNVLYFEVILGAIQRAWPEIYVKPDPFSKTRANSGSFCAGLQPKFPYWDKIDYSKYQDQ